MNLMKNGKMKTSQFFKIVAAKVGVTSDRYVADVYNGNKIRPSVLAKVRKAVRETIYALDRQGIEVSWHEKRKY